MRIDLGRTPYVLYGVKYIGLVSLACNSAKERPVTHTLTWVVRPMVCLFCMGLPIRGSRISIDLVSLMSHHAGDTMEVRLDLGRAPYGLYGANYIDVVSLIAHHAGDTMVVLYPLSAGRGAARAPRDFQQRSAPHSSTPARN